MAESLEEEVLSDLIPTTNSNLPKNFGDLIRRSKPVDPRGFIGNNSDLVNPLLELSQKDLENYTKKVEPQACIFLERLTKTTGEEM